MSLHSGKRPVRTKGIDTRNAKIINAFRSKSTGRTDLRDKATIQRLQMYKQRPKRDEDGKLVSGFLMNGKPDAGAKRVEPNRKWFGE